MRVLLALALLLLGSIAWFAFAPRERPPVNGIEVDSLPNQVGHTQSLTLDAPAPALSEARESASPADIRAIAVASTTRCRILGRAVDDVGAAIANATVKMWEWADFPEVLRTHEVRTEWDGRFVIECALPTGPKQSITVSAQPFHLDVEKWFGAIEAADSRSLTAGDVDAGTFELARCGAVEGRVVTADGTPIDVGVMLQANGHDGLASRTRADGSYSIGGVPPDRWLVNVRNSEWIVPGKTVVVVEPNRVTNAPDLVLTAAPTIQGIVVDTSGAPFARITVHGAGADDYPKSSAMTAADGTFVMQLTQLEQTTFSIAADCEQLGFNAERGDSRFTFEPGARNVRIVLERAPKMTFRVVDAATRASIENFSIILRCAGGSSKSSSDAIRSDSGTAPHAGGEITLSYGEKARVEVTSPGHAPFDAAVIADLGSTAVQTIALFGASSIRGRVLVSKQQAVGARVHAALRSSDDASGVRWKRGRGEGWSTDFGDVVSAKLAAKTAENGSFAILDLAAGNYDLAIEAPLGARTLIRGLVVLPGRALEIGDIEVAGEAIVKGVVRTAEGESPIGFVITLEDFQSTRVDNAEGRFEFRGLAAGRHWLVWNRKDEKAQPDSKDLRRIDFEVRAGETREVVIDAAASGPCSVTVRVRRRGEPVANAFVHVVTVRDLARETNRRVLARTNADGVAAGTMPSGERVEVLVIGANKRVIGRSATLLDLVAGGRFECDVEIGTGTIVVDLPATLERPEDGRITILVGDRIWTRLAAHSKARDSFSSPFIELVWAGNSVNFGEFPVGPTRVMLNFEKADVPATSGQPSKRPWIPLRDPYSTEITVEDGKETRIVVP